MNNKLRGKKLLVIGGASQHCKVVECAHRLGVEVFVTDYLENSPAKKIAEHSYMIDVMNIQELVDLCINEKIDGAISTSLDACQIPYQRLCEIMKYPCFGTKEQFELLTEKDKFKNLCKKYGLDVIPEYTVSDITESEEKVAYPIFVKPANSRGSRGQKVCYTKDEALNAIKSVQKESKNGKIIIEQYMKDKDDFTVSYLLIDGIPYIVRTGDRYEGTLGHGLSNLAVASASPSVYTDFYIKKISRKMEYMLKDIGLKTAPFFVQGFFDGSTIRFYDPGLRFAGGEYERILYDEFGIDLFEDLIYYALGVPRKTKLNSGMNIYSLEGKRLMQLDPTLKGGRIDCIEGLEVLNSFLPIKAISTRCQVGDTVFETGDVRQRFGEFCILSNSYDDEVRNIRYVQKILHVYNECGTDMVFDPFDTNRIRRVKG